MALIIVESPTKARTFNRIFKTKGNEKGYFVFATLGHIRDLPTGSISIDYTKSFKPTYEIMTKKQKIVTELKALAKDHNDIIFATDQDREGESISYHAAYILGFMDEKWPEIKLKKDLKDKKNISRIVFHEITPHALEEALKSPSDIRLDLVKAQQTRRILDRIVGYELSPLLWKKLGKNWLSAGRVQTVALRFIVEREKEINAFNKEDYFQIYAQFKPASITSEKDQEEFRAKLISKNDELFEQKVKIKLFASDYEYTKGLITKDTVANISADAKNDTYVIADVKETVVNKYPPPPFTTSLLQQEAINRYGFTSKMVMKFAQDLYERGLITYHRTDSFNLSTSFVFRAKDYIAETFGPEYALEKPRGYHTRLASAQEAHEAIRPTRANREPTEISTDKKLTRNHKLIYELIFNRAIATQMKEAQVKQVKVHVKGTKGYLYEAEFQKIVFDGFLKILSPEFVGKHQKDIIYKNGSNVDLLSLAEEAKQTLPPYRYSEASLIKTLEERGIGRPSTYSSILSLIQEKGYVEKEGRYMKPTGLGDAIADYLAKSFPQVFDIDFTAKMEEDLDRIAGGQEDIIKSLEHFFAPLKKELDVQKQDTSMIEVKEEATDPCPKCGSPLQIRFSKFGKFYACSAYPKCKFTKPFLKIVEGKKCPKDEGDIVVRYTKAKRKFYGCANYPKCDYMEFVWNKLVKKE